MAVSKGNRGKKKKRTQNHRAPVRPEVQKQEAEKAQQQRESAKKYLIMSMVSFAVMVIGFVMANYVGWYLIGYPISLIGALCGIYSAGKQSRGARVTQVCYGIYSALVIYMWVYRVFLLKG